jgi:predicted esterase
MPWLTPTHMLATALLAPVRFRCIGQTLNRLHVFITGSDMDEWIPEERSRQAARVLTDLGAEVTLRIYPSRPHIVSPVELAEAHAFLRSSAISVG